MSAADLVAVVAAVVALAAVAVAVVMVTRLQRAVDELGAAVAEVRSRAVPAVEALERRAAEIDDELRRAEGLLDRAEVVSARAETLSKVTYKAVADPVIRTAAAMKGTSRAARRLRRGDQHQPG